MDNFPPLESYDRPTNPGGLGGVSRFLDTLPASQHETAQQWLSGHEAYSIHKPVKLRYRRRKTIVAATNIQLQADLMDVTNLAKENNDKKYLLTAVDCFSREGFVFPLNSKHGGGVTHALKTIYDTHPYRYLQTDKGKEFLNSNVKAFCKQHAIHHFSTEDNLIKASLVERFNRTLRGKIYRYLTAKDTESYLEVLPDIVSSYNNSSHASIGMSPNDVSEENVADIFTRLYEPDKIPSWAGVKKPLFTSGDYVRISKTRRAFDRGYTPNWSVEAFIIVDKLTNVYPYSYRIKDLAEESVDGTFYEQELQKILKPTVFRIEKVIRRRSNRGQRQLFVKWIGYPEKFNEWISEEQVVDNVRQ